MSNNKNDEQAIVPVPIKFVHNFLQSVSHTDKKSNKQHLNFLIKEILKVKPPEQKKDPIDILIEAVIKGILGEMLS